LCARWAQAPAAEARVVRRPHMIRGVIGTVCLTLAACAVSTAHAQGRPRGPATLVARADSLAALDPATELRKAIERGDLRFIAVCGLSCRPPGVDLADSAVALAIRTGGLHYIEGTTDAVGNDAVARLDGVAVKYATRYNKLLARRLHLAQSPDST